MATPFVEYHQQGRIVRLTLNRPEVRNAFSTLQDCDDVIDAIRRAQDDRSVSCIVLTGAGASFCAGGNIKGMKARTGIGRQEQPDSTRAHYRRGVQRMIETLWNCELPIIAAINGHAMGLGLDLACLCDVRIAADSALFASSFIKVGIVPGDGGAWILPRIVGLSAAAELILTGDSINAAAAQSLGLVSRVVPREHLISNAEEVAARIVCNPPRALRLAKRLLREGQQQRLSDVLELSAAFQAIAHETRDHTEALDALLEKRPPRFTGE